MANAGSAERMPDRQMPSVVVLVLGMAYASTAYAQAARDGARNGTTAAPSRDRARLQQLQAIDSDLDIITFNHAQSAEQCERGVHYHGSFCERAWRAKERATDTLRTLLRASQC